MPKGDTKWRERLHAEIKRQGTNMKAVSLKAGLGETYVRDAIKRDRGGKLHELKKLAAALGKPEEWLISSHYTPRAVTEGIASILQEEDSRKKGTGDPAASSASFVSSFDPDDDIDPSAREVRMAENFFGRDVGDLPPGAILQVDVSLGMGGGGVTHVTEIPMDNGESYAAEGIKDWWRLPDAIIRGRFRVSAQRVRCFEAIGDSMWPTVDDGDAVFVDIGHRVPSPPGIYALADALGGVILKRLEISSGRNEDPVRVRIISDNPKHSAEERTLDEISIVGRYLGRLTTS